MASAREDPVKRASPLQWAALGSRVLAATAGAYAVTLLVSICISRWLPMDIGPATMSSMLISFWIFAGCVLWVFACRTASRAWVGLAVIAGLGLVGLLVR